MKSLLSITLIALGNALFAQSSYYFQQEVNYKIDVTLNDQNHTLSGREEFEYVNNSSKTLDSIFIHLWPNAYKGPKSAMAKQKFKTGDFFLLYANPESLGYIDSLHFTVNNQEATWSYFQGYEDIAVLRLNQPLPPGGRCTVKTPFFVKLPSGSISRLGHIEQTYQITQWYPKPAVFDKDGWHAMPYLTQGEFYSEFGSFDVNITLPENYVLAATGNIQTPSEQKWLDEKAKAVYGVDEQMVFDTPESSSKMKTVRYKQDRVHDFGWFADKTWIVQKGEVELPHSKRKVTTYAMFTPSSFYLWDSLGVESINHALYHYSLWSGDYPYDVCTAVDGTISAGGGMEYPTITIIGSTGNAFALKQVIVHEVGHNWFYGILGSNERDHAWMDEGINSFFETRTMRKFNEPMTGAQGMRELFGIGLNGADYSYSRLTEELPYVFMARLGQDQPIDAPSEYYSEINYGGIVYKKTAIAFNFLMQYLGEDMMNTCMAAYFDQWKFKHPTPADIEEVFEKTSGQNLDWFFGDMVRTTGAMNMRAICTSSKKEGMRLKVRNTGSIKAPCSIQVFRDGQLIDSNGNSILKDDTNQSSAWIDPIAPGESAEIMLGFVQPGDIIKVNDIDAIPELDRKDNRISTTGIFPRVEPVHLGLFSGLENPRYSQMYLQPLVGWNNNNKWMFGVGIHNKTLPTKAFQWSLNPMYSIATNSMNGYARIEHSGRYLQFGVRGQSFADVASPYDASEDVKSYNLISPFVQIKLFGKRTRRDVSGNISFNMFSMQQTVKGINAAPFSKQTYVSGWGGSRTEHFRLSGEIFKRTIRSLFHFKSSFEMGEMNDYRLAQEHTAEWELTYLLERKRKVFFRSYLANANGLYWGATGQSAAAGFDSNSPQNAMSSDYLYDGTFLGRGATSGLLARQLMGTQGGLLSPTRQVTNGMMAGFNIQCDIPWKIPVRPYAGIVWMQNSRSVSNVELTSAPIKTNFEVRTLWNVGVAFPLLPKFLTVYMPLAYSSNIHKELDARDINFGRSIQFELNLPLIEPFGLIRNSIGKM
jgi:hypothetical protein